MLRFIVTSIAAAAAFACAPASAQDYPTKPIKIIVPFAAGGPADVYARFIGVRLQEALGQPVVVEDRPGAGSIIGTDAVAKSAPDGYTLLMMSNTQTVNETLIPNKPYQLMRDFVPVTPINYSDLVLVVHPSVGANSLADLIRIAKASPGKLNYASSGPGTPYHMAGELFKAMAGVDIVHVPYKGSSGARTDVLGGQVQMMFDAVPTMSEHAKGGRVKALGTTGKARSAVLPGVPTIAEARRPRLRGRDLARHHGAEGHAGADRRPAECRDRQDPEPAGGPAGVGEPGRAADGDAARRVHPLSQRRHRQVGAHREDLRSEGRPVTAALRERFTLHVNGVPRAIDADRGTPLLDILRSDLALKGTRFGCGDDQCGACNVLVDGHAVAACSTPIWAAAGRSVTTVEGLGSAGSPHRLQRAFLDEQAAQCGYCTAGMLISAAALLARVPQPSAADVRSALDRNLCRCGAHNRIVRAVLRAAAAASVETQTQ